MNEFVTFNNGVKMPMIGFGTYQMPSKITQRCVIDAINVGYRHIDTAQCYGNECEVGQAVRNSGLKREEIFITTKLWSGRGYKDTISSIEESLRNLNIDYIDLLLIHEPSGDFNEIYRAMETKYQEGVLKSIGVANFLENNFSKLMTTAKIIPAVNQIETHVFRQQIDMNNLLKKYGTIHESWSPLACGKNNIFSNRILKNISENHNKTVAQVALRFLYQQKIPIIPKSTHIERMRENFAVTDFELTDEEMKKIKKLDEGKSLFSWW